MTDQDKNKPDEAELKKTDLRKSDKLKAVTPIDVIDREMTEALRYNAYSLNSWLALTGETAPDKALAAYIKLMEASNKLRDLKNDGVTLAPSINIIISEDGKSELEKFLNIKDDSDNN